MTNETEHNYPFCPLDCGVSFVHTHPTGERKNPVRTVVDEINETDKWIEERVNEFERRWDTPTWGSGASEFGWWCPPSEDGDSEDTREPDKIKSFIRTTLIAHTAHLKEQLLGEMPKRKMGGLFQGGYNSAIDDMTAVINKL